MMLMFALFATALAAGIVVTKVYERFTVGITVWVKGYHLHHSLYGLALLAVAVLFHLTHPDILLLILISGIGIGIIIQHTRSENRFVFVDRDGRLRHEPLVRMTFPDSQQVPAGADD